MSKCKLTVLKCLFDPELKAIYVDDPDYGPCPYFKPGDVIYYEEGGRPESFGCSIAWQTLERDIKRFAVGGMPEGLGDMPAPPQGQPPAGAPAGKGPKPGEPQVLCCNDGIRPVIFCFETVD